MKHIFITDPDTLSPHHGSLVRVEVEVPLSHSSLIGCVYVYTYLGYSMLANQFIISLSHLKQGGE